MADAMSRAYTERPFLAPNTRASLDVVPTGVSWTTSGTFTTSDFTYDMGDGTALTITRPVKGGSYTIKMYTEAATTNLIGTKTCSSVGELGDSVCQSLVGVGIKKI